MLQLTSLLWYDPFLRIDLCVLFLQLTASISDVRTTSPWSLSAPFAHDLLII